VKEEIEASQVGSAEKKSFWRKYFPCFFRKESNQTDKKEPDVHPVKSDEGIVPALAVEPTKVAQQSAQLAPVELTESSAPVPIVVEQKGIDEPELVEVKILPSNLHSPPKKEEQFPRKVQQSKSPSASTMMPKVVPKVAENKIQSSIQNNQAPIKPTKTRQEINASIKKKWLNAPAVVEPSSYLPLSRFKPTARNPPVIPVKRKEKNCLPVSMEPSPKEKEEKVAPVVEPNLPQAPVIKPDPEPVSNKPAAVISPPMPVDKKEEIVQTLVVKEEKIAPSVERTLSSALDEVKKDVQVSTVEVLRPDVPVQLISEAPKVSEALKVATNESQQH